MLQTYKTEKYYKALSFTSIPHTCSIFKNRYFRTKSLKFKKKKLIKETIKHI